MDNRDAIIRKLNALKAKALNAGSPEEAATFMNGFNKLMQKYRLTETDLEVKNSSIHSTVKTPKKEFSDIERIAVAVATVTETKALKTGNSVAFLGLKADVQYADWLFDLVHSSLDRGYHALHMTPEYHYLLNNNVKPAQIKNNFKIGFLAGILVSLHKIIEENRKPGTAIVLLKNAIIQRFIDENGGSKPSKSKAPVLYDGAASTAAMGFREGQEVKLRQTMESEVKGYLK